MIRHSLQGLLSALQCVRPKPCSRLMTHHGECQGNEELGKLRLNSPAGKHARELWQDVGVAIQLVHFHVQVTVLQGCCAGLGLRYGDPQGCWQPVGHLQGAHYHTPGGQVTHFMTHPLQEIGTNA